MEDAQNITAMDRYLSEYPPVLGPADAAKILGVSVRCVQKQIKAGKIRAGKVGKLYRIPKDRLIEYIEGIGSNGNNEK